MLKTLSRQIGQYRKDAILTPVLTAMEVVMEILIPYVIASLIDKGIQNQDMSNTLKYGGFMLLLALCSLFFGVMAGRTAAAAATGYAANLRSAMYENIQKFSFSNIDKFSTAGLVTRMTTDVSNLQNAFQMIIRIAIRAPFMLISSVMMCLAINRRISLIFFAAILFLGGALILIIRYATPVFNSVFEKYDDLNASVQENISAIRVVKAFVREDYENSRFTDAATSLFRLFVKAENYVVLNTPLMSLTVYFCIIGISWFGAHFIVAGEMTTGNLTSLFAYISNILISLMILSMIFVMITMSTASARRIAEVLEEKTDISDPSDPVFEIPDGSIDFFDVDFAYRSPSAAALSSASPDEDPEDTLHDIELHIRSGETIGIIGGTGCGKSSLVALVSRLYDVSKGKVCVGGRDVRTYDIKTLRENVSVVLQKNELFSGTILDNLRWAKEDATLEECRHACEMACADEFISRFPDGYETRIEQGGTNVSGGQKQRLCIARALLKSPKILILDDSTSACDTATDSRIREALSRHIPGVTKLIIAQRITSVQDADRIIVMDDGRISAFDTHENLLQQNRIYREICTTQMQGGGDFDQPA